MSQYISENWSNLETPGLRKVFFDYLRQQTSNLPALFSMQTSKKAEEFDLQVDDQSTWQKFEGTITYGSEREGYKTTYTHEEYVDGKKVHRKLLMDDLYNVIERIPRRLSLGANRHRERSGAGVFNDAFNTSVVGADAVSLCNTAHPSRNMTASRSNTGTLTLSPANVETTRRNMIAFRTGTNEIIDVNPDMLIVPTELEEKAWEIINSRGKVDTAQNNANFHQGKYKLLVWKNWLTSGTRWFMVDSQYMKEFLLWFDREPVQFFKDRDFGTLVAAYAGYMRYSRGWSDWLWVFGQNP